MKKNFFALGFCALVLGLAACGDDSSSNSEPNVVKGELLALADGSGEKLCDEKLEGWVAEAIGKDFRRCQNGEWTKITASEASAEEEIIGGVTELQSSSSIQESSSSTITISSSSTPTEDPASSSSGPKANWAYLNPGIGYGTMTDARDGQVYKTVAIGSQTWMAENLNYSDKNISGYCYGDDASNCSKYGRLYLWSAAMDSAGAFSTAGKGCGKGKVCNANGTVRGVCPEGWHLPSDNEWKYLWALVGGTSVAGAKLKSTSGWYNDGNGTDSFGFAVLPAGYRDNFGNYNDDGLYAFFWSSSENDGYYAYHWFFDYDRGHVRHNDYSKDYGFPVRCLSDASVILSSSSESLSSAAIEEKSSSSAGKPNWRYLNPDIDYGEFTDVRDGQIYKTVAIGSQTWMAENLNYAPVDVASMGEGAWSGCYNNEADSCAKYGRLYTWNVAMDNADCAEGKECKPNGTVQGVCPSGWHMPTKEEWQELLEPLATRIEDKINNLNYYGVDVVLKTVEGWISGSSGTNATGFSALPAGHMFFMREYIFGQVGVSVCFWSASESSSGSTKNYLLISNDPLNLAYGAYKLIAYSVRCVQDESKNAAVPKINYIIPVK